MVLFDVFNSPIAMSCKTPRIDLFTTAVVEVLDNVIVLLLMDLTEVAVPVRDHIPYVFSDNPLVMEMVLKLHVEVLANGCTIVPVHPLKIPKRVIPVVVVPFVLLMLLYDTL
ncbi:hypothetical protein GCM10022390_060 [Flavobacterium anseonense]